MKHFPKKNQVFSLGFQRCGGRGLKDNVHSFFVTFGFDGFPKPNLKIHMQSTGRLK